jgi:hypothetical protein
MSLTNAKATENILMLLIFWRAFSSWSAGTNLVSFVHPCFTHMQEYANTGQHQVTLQIFNRRYAYLEGHEYISHG